VYDVIFENGGAEIFVSVNTRLCVNVALNGFRATGAFISGGGGVTAKCAVASPPRFARGRPDNEY